jgi:site-specific DNA-methyltransferase (adenine-specific)
VTKKPTLKVENRPLASLKPYWRNPRKNDGAVEAVKKSILEFGFNSPILVDAEGTIVAGHTRYKAAKALGLASVPVVVVDLPADKITAYRIADNKTSELAEWDMEALTQELRTIADAAESMSAYFDPATLNAALNIDFDAATPTQAQVDSITQAHATAFGERSRAAQDAYVEVTCPECGGSFHLDRGAILAPPAKPEPAAA